MRLAVFLCILSCLVMFTIIANADDGYFGQPPVTPDIPGTTWKRVGPPMHSPREDTTQIEWTVVPPEYLQEFNEAWANCDIDEVVRMYNLFSRMEAQSGDEETTE